MTDKTSPRDRAIEVCRGRRGWPLASAPEVIDALLANPEVLRALAAAPTADVDALRVALDGLESAGCQFWACEGPTLEPIDMVTCRTCIAIAKVRAELEAAAPEGVDALRQRLRSVMHLEDWQAESDDDLVLAAESCYRKADLYGPKYAAAPEGVTSDHAIHGSACPPHCEAYRELFTAAPERAEEDYDQGRGLPAPEGVDAADEQSTPDNEKEI